jgi:hypothetical protein
LCAGFGFDVVAVVEVVVAVVGVVVAAAVVLVVWVELDEADPQALTINVSRTVASGMRICLMVLSRTPGSAGCFPVDRRRWRSDEGGVLNFGRDSTQNSSRPDLNSG